MNHRRCRVAIAGLTAAAWIAGGGAIRAQAPDGDGAAPVTPEEPQEQPAAPITPESEPEPKVPPPPTRPPETDIFLMDLDTAGVLWKATQVTRVTDRDAYDNQPYFEPDGESLLFTSAADGQTDIARYSIAEAATERVTETPESEYSPTPTPGWPGFSTVRVEADGTQRLWRFCSSGGCTPEVVFEEIAPVGYHAWIGPETVAMFVLGEPHELVVADTLTQEPRTAAQNIGRALHRVPGRNAVSFVDKSIDDMWTVSILDLDTDKVTKIVQTPPGSEDFVWWSEKELLIGFGSKLFHFDLDESDAWREVADLAEHGIAGITRMSVSPLGGRLAVVSERTESEEP